MPWLLLLPLVALATEELPAFTSEDLDSIREARALAI